MKLKLLAVAALTMQLGACATVTNGSSQTIAFTTGAVEGADCNMQGGRDEAVNENFQTPAEVKVRRSKNPLNVECSKSGYKTATKVVDSDFNATTGGNLLIGGVVGGVVDSQTGAMYNYPEKVDLPLEPAAPAAVGTPIAK